MVRILFYRNVLAIKIRGYLAFILPVSRLVVRTFTGDLPLTTRASLSTKWLRRKPVLRGLVCFFGLPIQKQLLCWLYFYKLDSHYSTFTLELNG
jgi:hypothetical protein